MKTMLKTNCGRILEIDSTALNLLKKEAREAYKSSIIFLNETKKMSNREYLKFKKTFKGNTDFQYYTSDYIISYKTSLLIGDFKGYDYQLQFLNANQGVPAGTIVKI